MWPLAWLGRRLVSHIHTDPPPLPTSIHSLRVLQLGDLLPLQADHLYALGVLDQPPEPARRLTVIQTLESPFVLQNVKPAQCIYKRSKTTGIRP